MGTRKKFFELRRWSFGIDLFRVPRGTGFWLFLVLLLPVLLIFVSGCSSTPKKSTFNMTQTQEPGVVIYQGEIQFKLPPADWLSTQITDRSDFEIGFFKIESESLTPAHTMFIFDENPYGSSNEVEKRSQQFFKRFFWNDSLRFQVTQRQEMKLTNFKEPALVVWAEGSDPYKNQKAKSKIYFFKRGERVATLICTQRRSLNDPYDDSAFQVFDDFVMSFKFIKKSFYEELSMG